MSVREFLQAADVDEVSISHEGTTTQISRDDQLLVDAFGDYIIDKLRFTTESEIIFCEITLKTSFLKKEAA